MVELFSGLSILWFILAVVWIIMPFYVFKIARLLEKQNKISMAQNRILKRLISKFENTEDFETDFDMGHEVEKFLNKNK